MQFPGVSSPVLARHKKVSKRLEVGDTASEQQFSSVEDHYRAIYFEAIDTVIGTIKNRFDQEGFQMLQKLEAVLFSGDSDSCNLSEIVQFYASDFRSVDVLGTQLTLLRSAMKDEDINLKSILLYLQSLSSEQREYFAEVIKLVKLILVMPATNATSERSFSALRRLKTWLRAVEAQQRLNWCMVLHVHKDRTDKLEIADLANEFVSRNASRMHIFGSFV